MAQKLTKQEFVERAKKAHPNEDLDYSRFNYVNQLTKGIIIDHDINPDTGEEYGEYMQSPKLHMAGCGHPLKAAQRKRKAVILPREDFIKRDRIVHEGENIEYGEYLGMNKKMRFVDHDINPETGKEYGEYYCLPSNHLKGDGFPGKRRRIGNSEMAKKANKAALEVRTAADKTALFIKKARKVHQGENLDYSKVHYVNNQVPVIIIDHDINPDTGKEYGEYRQTPAMHLKGRGHRLKGIQREKKKRACTTEEFIKRAKAAHPNENLDYSKVNYVNMFTPVTIIDHDINPKTGKEYGEYSQLPVNHLKGSGHPEKSKNRVDEVRRLGKDEFIRRAKSIHSGKEYDYSKAKYNGYDNPLLIIDHSINPETRKEYGEFYQTPSKHLAGHDNPMRKNEKISESNAYTQEQAISEMRRVHPEPYFDFSKTIYKRRDDELTVICHNKDKNGNEHGEFKTTFARFVSSKYACPKCNECGTSLKQKEVYDFICRIVGKDNVVENYRGILNSTKQSIDIYIPSKRIGIEFDGLFWHSTGSPNYQGNLAILNKTEECESKGVFLIHIFEDEWDEHKEIVKDKLAYLIGGHRVIDRIGARKCTVNTILKHDSDTFLDENHLQGKASATYYFGGFYENQLVAVMLFKRCPGKSDEYELNRYATLKGFVIQGMASKMLYNFIKLSNPNRIVSFADRRWISPEKNLYKSLGFCVERVIKPSYWYCGKRELLHRFHKFSFRKSILNKKYGFPMSMTESEMVKQLNINKIYDCGLIKYVLAIK